MKNDSKYKYLKHRDERRKEAELYAPCSTTHLKILNKAFCPQLNRQTEGKGDA